VRDLIEDLERIDRAVYAAIAQTPSPALDAGLRRLTRAADYSRVWLSCAAVLATVGGSRGRRAAVTGLGAVAVSSSVANVLLKPLGRRSRPDASSLPAARRAEMPASTSFPSGHTASAFAFATGVGAVAPAQALPIRALAALVAYSRVHTGVHYPGDVIAGAFLGTTIGHAVARATHAGER
jgi:membrane-associated phospholipid phosphatase